MSERKRQIAILAMLAALFIGVVIIMPLYFSPKAVAESGMPNSTFSQPFNQSLGTAQSFVTLKNLGQLASSVEYVFSGGGTGCRMLLEASSDNSHWSVLAQAISNLNGSTSFIYANGFFNYFRLDFNPDNMSECSSTTVAGSYYGFSSPLSVARSDATAFKSGISTPSAIYEVNSIYSVDGLQCTNDGTSAAWLQLFDATSTPTLGTGMMYEVEIPANGTFTFSGPASFIGQHTLYLGAATSAGGSTAGGPVECNAQINLAGPWYPILPTAP